MNDNPVILLSFVSSKNFIIPHIFKDYFFWMIPAGIFYLKSL